MLIPLPLRVEFTTPADDDGAVEYDPAVDKFLAIKGKKLDEGCSREDYRITVGVANCTIVDFTSNEIVCEPPVYMPEVNTIWSSYCGNSSRSAAVMAQIGADPENTLFVYCVKYKQDSRLAYIVGCTVGSASLLVIIIVTVACYQRHKRQHNSHLNATSPVERPLPHPDRNSAIYTSITTLRSLVVTRRSSLSSDRGFRFRNRKSKAMSYMSGPFPGTNRRYLYPYYPCFPLGMLPEENIYGNVNDIEMNAVELHSYINTELHHDGGSQKDTSDKGGVDERDKEPILRPDVRLRPASMFPDDESTSTKGDRRVLRQQNTQSLYPTD